MGGGEFGIRVPDLVQEGFQGMCNGVRCTASSHDPHEQGILCAFFLHFVFSHTKVEGEGSNIDPSLHVEPRGDIGPSVFLGFFQLLVGILWDHLHTEHHFQDLGS